MSQMAPRVRQPRSGFHPPLLANAMIERVPNVNGRAPFAPSAPVDPRGLAEPWGEDHYLEVEWRGISGFQRRPKGGEAGVENGVEKRGRPSGTSGSYRQFPIDAVGL